MAFVLKVGDTRPPLRATLIGADKQPLNLTDTDIKFRMKPLVPGHGSEVPLKAAQLDYIDPDDPGSGTDPTLGRVRYEWDAGDTDAAGVHRAEFVVVWGDGTVGTFPNGGSGREYVDVNILEHA